MQCMLKSCTKCEGDLVFDDGDWRCVQCARYYYGESLDMIAPPNLPFPSVETEKLVGDPSAVFQAGFVTVARRTDSAYRAGSPTRKFTDDPRVRANRSINSVIQAKSVGESRWWVRNRQVIEYLDQGLSVREISLLTDRGQRQIRVVRERLTDLRAEA